MCTASSPRGCHGLHTASEPVCGAHGSSQPVKGRKASGRGQEPVYPRDLPRLPGPCLLDGLQHHCWRRHRKGTPGGGRCWAWSWQCQQRKVEVVGSMDNTSLLKGALVWHQGISEFMVPDIGSNIWGLRCTQSGVGGERREGWSSRAGGPTHPRRPWQAPHSQ